MYDYGLPPPARAVARPFSTEPANNKNNEKGGAEPDLQTTILQRLCWEAYLGSGRGSETLFRSIDVGMTGKVSRTDILQFLESVGAAAADNKDKDSSNSGGVNAKAFQILDMLADDHPIDLKEFKSWLIIATKFSNIKNTSYKVSYENRPDLGPRRVSAKKKPTEEKTPEQELEEESKYAEEYSWNEVTMSQSLRRMQYAVRGEVVMKADQLKSQGRDILFTNIGNPHSVGQKPLTFNRQVLALCDLPAEVGIDNPHVHQFFPNQDVIDRATRIMKDAVGPAGTGAYTNSQGILPFRQDVAQFIEKRDGHEAYAGDIFLTNGASGAIDMVLTALIAGDTSAIMIPIPQYPIYSALITRLGGRQVGYLLDEAIGWAVTRQELDQKLEQAKQKGLDVRALAIINPGNPTGQVLSREDLQVVCTFCAENDIVLLADEVYQRNVYVDDKEFVSAKKVVLETPGCENLQLVSFHSTSKGLIGECGRRGGYMELHNISPYVQSQLYKLASSGLCSCVTGQIMTSLMVKPPQPGDDSYENFAKEEASIYGRLKQNASTLVDGLNKVDGIDCVRAEGAMYAFPRLSLPPKAFEEADKQDCTPDTLYALSLLEETGICVVPASGFGQEKGRVGFRTTFLPPEDKIENAIDEIARHHELFCNKYA